MSSSQSIQLPAGTYEVGLCLSTNGAALDGNDYTHGKVTVFG